MMSSSEVMMSESTAPKARRKSGLGDHIKHRRTRSGCFTCRSRRVKCDEARPLCERCRKGNRDCVYPDLSPKKPAKRKSAANLRADPSSPESSSSESDGEAEVELPLDAGQSSTGALQTLPEETTMATLSTGHTSHPSSSGNLTPGRRRSLTRKSSETPSLTQDKSPSPSTEASGPTPSSHAGIATFKIPPKPSSALLHAAVSAATKPDWSHLAPDLQFYLNYHYDHLTPFTYSFRHDGGPFLRTTFLQMALRHKPLLYGVVGFAAFQYALTKPDSQLQDFLGYYTTAVSYLRNSLRRLQKHNVATLLTILQLATIEEYLGDWVNLQSHQKAAYEILTELYTPQTIMRSDMQRVILDWYSRFDLFAGLMAESDLVLSREWFESYQDYYVQSKRDHPDDLIRSMDYAIAEYRMLAMDMAALFAKASKGAAPRQDLVGDVAALSQRLRSWRADLDPRLMDPANFVTEFGSAQALDVEIVDPFEAGLIFSPRFWRLNFAMLGWYATDMMLRQETALMMGQLPPSELDGSAKRVCQGVEAIQIWPDSPPGSIFSAQASLAIAGLFLPKDDRHTMWLRRKFAEIESLGYIYPPTFRTKMAKLWNVPEVEQWWLPSDEGYPRIVRNIRSFVEERATQPQDSPTSDLKDMKGIFKALRLHDDGSNLSDSINSSPDVGHLDLPLDASTGPNGSDLGGGNYYLGNSPEIEMSPPPHLPVAMGATAMAMTTTGISPAMTTSLPMVPTTHGMGVGMEDLTQGRGHGLGNGNGNGHGSGVGIGSGYGNGHGSGDGDGGAHGNGSGHGNENGGGNGIAHGHGHGHGYGGMMSGMTMVGEDEGREGLEGLEGVEGREEAKLYFG